MSSRCQVSRLGDQRGFGRVHLDCLMNCVSLCSVRCSGGQQGTVSAAKRSAWHGWHHDERQPGRAGRAAVQRQRGSMSRSEPDLSMEQLGGDSGKVPSPQGPSADPTHFANRSDSRVGLMQCWAALTNARPPPSCQGDMQQTTMWSRLPPSQGFSTLSATTRSNSVSRAL
jgi:hypothetical protein